MTPEPQQSRRPEDPPAQAVVDPSAVCITLRNPVMWDEQQSKWVPLPRINIETREA